MVPVVRRFCDGPASRTFPLILAALLGPIAVGCVGYQVKPPKPEPARAQTKSPLTIAVRTDSSFEYRGVGMSNASVERLRGRRMFTPIFEQTDDFGGKLVRALRDSGAFARVDEVKNLAFGSSAPTDVLIDAKLKGVYIQDPATMGKAFICGFLMFLPVPFTRWTDRFEGSADVTVYDSAGRPLNMLSEKAEVTTVAALFSAGMPAQIAAGLEGASLHLAKKATESVISASAQWGVKPGQRPAPVAQAPSVGRYENGALVNGPASDAAAASGGALVAGASSELVAAGAADGAAHAAAGGSSAASGSAPAGEAAVTESASAPRPKKPARRNLTPSEIKAIEEELLP